MFFSVFSSCIRYFKKVFLVKCGRLPVSFEHTTLYAYRIVSCRMFSINYL